MTIPSHVLRQFIPSTSLELYISVEGSFVHILLVFWEEVSCRCGAYNEVITVFVVPACEIDDCRRSGVVIYAGKSGAPSLESSSFTKVISASVSGSDFELRKRE